jgi:hypothetical protein
MKKTQKRLIPPTLTDKDWQDLRKPSGLPDSARNEIENIIRFLPDDSPNQNPWSGRMQDARLAMTDARIKLRKAIKSLNSLRKTEAPSFMEKLHPAGGNVIGWLDSSRPKIIVALEAIDDLLGSFPKDESVIPHAPSGRSRSNLRVALEQLNGLLLKTTGRGLNQSQALLKFAHAVCSKGEPNTTKEAVLWHIKNIKRVHRRRGPK